MNQSGPQVIGLDSSMLNAWDEYVRAHAAGSFFHLSGWKQAIEEAFGHKPHFLCVVNNGSIDGVLPLFHIKSVLFGSSLSSSPFCVYGGILASSESAETLLREAACQLAEKLKVDALEFRDVAPKAPDWETKELYYTFRKPILPDVEANMKAIPNKQRAMVRKGIKAGLHSEETDDAGRLYRVYSESVRNLGTPVFTSRYFQILQKMFGEDCRILMITQNGKDVAGVLSFYFKGEVLPYYGGSIAAARFIKGCNDFMYWELMRRSCEEGLESFDFGRSKKGTGPFSFKKNWGFEPTPLFYQYFLVQAEQMPDVNPLNPKYKLMVDTWKKLPLPVANLVGPFLAKNLG